MKKPTLEDYIKKVYPEKEQEYIRYITPYYYEPGVIYRAITTGFGEMSKCIGTRRLMIKEGTYDENDIQIILFDVDVPTESFVVFLSEAHLQIKKEVDETPKGVLIPNNRNNLIIVHNEKKYEIRKSFWRDNRTNKLTGYIRVFYDIENCLKNRRVYYELYSYLSGGWCFSHVNGYDSVGREIYTVDHNYSVRKFKKMVFGDSNFKLEYPSTQTLYDQIILNKCT